jgi:AcrR family transcriptional regulator
MPRWELGSAERMRQAALELFQEQGFEDTSAVQIAARARVTTRTFFRYFPDKEEVLFADSDDLREALVERLAELADTTEPLRAVTHTLAGFDWERLGSRETQRRREAMIAANPRLLERELVKQQQIADGFRAALRRRGVEPEVAELAAAIGIQVFRTAYRQWLDGDGTADLTGLTDAATSLLATIVPTARASRGRGRIIPA